MREKNGRDEGGRFAAGNPGGPGNPFARKTAALRKAAADFATADQVRVVLAAMFLKAQEGDVAAARLFLAYTLGKPGPAADPDTLDAHEADVRRQAAEAADALRAAPASRPEPPTMAAEPRPEPTYADTLRDVCESLSSARLSLIPRSSSASTANDADRPPTAATDVRPVSDGGRHAPSPNGDSGRRDG